MSETPETMQARANAMATILTRIAEDDLAQAKRPTEGKTVEVVKGRKVPVGTMGPVVHHTVAPSHFHDGTDERVCIAGPDGQVWTSASNVIVTDPENWLDDWQAMVEAAADATRAEAEIADLAQGADLATVAEEAAAFLDGYDDEQARELGARLYAALARR